MKQYLDLLKDILKNGEERDDRTGIGTISVFGRQLRFDMQAGFPAVTTKKLMWCSVVSELLWFLEGSTNEHRLAEIKNDNKPYSQLTEKERKTIWTLNAENQGKDLGYISGNLGPVYSKQWVNQFTIDYNTYEIVDNVVFHDEYKEPVFEELTVEYSDDPNIGKEFTSNCGHVARVISFVEMTKNSHRKYKVQFKGTNSTKIVDLEALRTGAFKDNYAFSVYGVAKLGDVSEEDKNQPLYSVLSQRWNHMISRCYNPNCKEFKQYGAIGVKVCNRWLTFANFLEDICQVYNYNLFAENPSMYQIDKDIFGAKVYSKDTCIFIPKYYNQRLINSKPLMYKGKLYLNAHDFCEQNDWASHAYLMRSLRGIKSKKYEGVEYAQIPEGKHIRYKLCAINQIQTVIDKIKNNPTDRRILVSAWNVAELNKMALPPCHYSFQFYVSGKNKEYLSLMWNQRSVDSFLGLPFNIASYGLLLHIIARITNKIPYELIGNLGDTHVYKNHLDVVRKQIERSPHKLPELEMPNADYSSLDAFLKSVKTSDFKLKNYICDETLKAPMAV